MPQWLDELTPDDIYNGHIPIDEVLADSVYYPAAGTDGSPVWLLGSQWTHLIDGPPATSYVYVDCDTAVFARHFRELEEPGFRGYESLGNKIAVGIPLQKLRLADPLRRPRRPRRAEEFDDAWHGRRPFAAYWSVFQRQEELDDDHGPPRFSLLYIGGEALATYQALYARQGRQPRVLALIQPGRPPGRPHWHELRDPDGPFALAVLNNSPKPPRYLLAGGSAVRDNGDAMPRYSACWPQYGRPRCDRLPAVRYFRGLWEYGDYDPANPA